MIQALEYLSSLKPGTLPSKTQVLTEGILFCNPVCFTSKPGQFMVCFPSDAHKVGMMFESPAPIRKIVFKIRCGK